MWNPEALDALSEALPFAVSVQWDTRPSSAKYGHVNSLLAALRVFHELGATLVHPSGAAIAILRVAPLKRRLTDQHKRTFSIVGHDTGNPISIAILGQLQVDVYFNQHLFVEAETTFRQYFPSASVILRPRNFLTTQPVASPGSWGSDIIWMSYDWPGTLVLEAAASDLTGSIRRNFRGFKLLPAAERHFIAPKRPPARDRTLLQNNGFTNLILGSDLNSCWPPISRTLKGYIRSQSARLRARKGG